MKRRFQSPRYGFNKQTFLFIAGLAGVAHETLLEHAERPTLLVLFAAMMGLPAFLGPGQSQHPITPAQEVVGEAVQQDEQRIAEQQTMRQLTEHSQERE
jgi:hypothetical protein